MRRAAAIVLLTAALGAALAASAVAQTQKTSLPDVEDEVMCVVCGTALNLAEAPQADRERAFIQGLIDRGLTKDQIKAQLKDEYGEQVLALPEDDGIGIAVYVVPIVVVLLAAIAIAFALPRWRRRPAASAATAADAPATPTDAETRRLDEDLARFEG